MEKNKEFSLQTQIQIEKVAMANEEQNASVEETTQAMHIINDKNAGNESLSVDMTFIAKNIKKSLENEYLNLDSLTNKSHDLSKRLEYFKI